MRSSGEVASEERFQIKQEIDRACADTGETVFVCDPTGLAGEQRKWLGTRVQHQELASMGRKHKNYKNKKQPAGQ